MRCDLISCRFLSLKTLARLHRPQSAQLRKLSAPTADSGGPTCKADKQLLAKPKEPGLEDCCQTGCKECVWEVYWRELKVNAALVKG